jgi:hypothetical protein
MFLGDRSGIEGLSQMNNSLVLCSCWRWFEVGVGSLVAAGWLYCLFFFLFEVLPEWMAQSHRQTRELLSADDPDHPLAEQRAWDRRLLELGMLPIYNSDDPFTLRVSNGTQYYLEFVLDKRKHLVLRPKILQKPKLQEATRSRRE